MLCSFSAMYCANLGLSPSASPIWRSLLLLLLLNVPGERPRDSSSTSHGSGPNCKPAGPLALSETHYGVPCPQQHTRRRKRVTRPCQPLGSGRAASLKIAWQLTYEAHTGTIVSAAALVMTETCSPCTLGLGAGSTRWAHGWHQNEQVTAGAAL
jgi:hypothetical protein